MQDIRHVLGFSIFGTLLATPLPGDLLNRQH